MTKKERWLRAYKKTRDEYVNDTHIADPGICAKCLIVHPANGCEGCPEETFAIGGFGGCTSRFTYATDSGRLSKKKKKRIIEYHNRAIEWLESQKRFSLKRFSKEILEIDEDIMKRVRS